MGAVSEEEFDQQKAEYTAEDAARIQQGSLAKENTKQKSLSSIYGQSLADRKIGLIGIALIVIIALSEVFFVTLLIFSYFPATKNLVSKIMSYLT